MHITRQCSDQSACIIAVGFVATRLGSQRCTRGLTLLQFDTCSRLGRLRCFEQGGKLQHQSGAVALYTLDECKLRRGAAGKITEQSDAGQQL